MITLYCSLMICMKFPFMYIYVCVLLAGKKLGTCGKNSKCLPRTSPVNNFIKISKRIIKWIQLDQLQLWVLTEDKLRPLKARDIIAVWYLRMLCCMPYYFRYCWIQDQPISVILCNCCSWFSDLTQCLYFTCR